MQAIAAVRGNFAVRDIAAVVLGSVLLGLLAHAAIPLPFTPVPIVLQCQTALMLGLLLGSRKGALAVLLFLLQGAVGLPVFSFGQSGIAYLLGPKGGYLMGYAAGAFLAGWLFERAHEKSRQNAFFSLAAGNTIVFALGAMQLSLYLGIKQAILLGVAPFVLADICKLLLAVLPFKSKQLTR